jgi:hypothetical protein
MRDMDALYPSLYDLFNQRYIPDQVKPGRKLCQIAHGTSVNTVIVHQNFKCILLMDKPTPEDQLDSDNFEEKWPTALLNRFEKHIFILEELVDPETFSLIELTRETLQKGALNPEQYIHNYSKILVESSIARGTKRKKIELTEKDQKQVIEKEISLNLINTAEKEKVHQRESAHEQALSVNT